MFYDFRQIWKPVSGVQTNSNEISVRCSQTSIQRKLGGAKIGRSGTQVRTRRTSHSSSALQKIHVIHQVRFYSLSNIASLFKFQLKKSFQWSFQSRRLLKWKSFVFVFFSFILIWWDWKFDAGCDRKYVGIVEEMQFHKRILIRLGKL